MFGMLAMALFLDTYEKLPNTRGGFSLGRIATIVSVMGQYLLNGYFLPRIREFSIRIALVSLANVAFCIGAIWAPGLWPALLWLVAFVVDYALATYAFSTGTKNGEGCAAEHAPNAPALPLPPPRSQPPAQSCLSSFVSWKQECVFCGFPSVYARISARAGFRIAVPLDVGHMAERFGCVQCLPPTPPALRAPTPPHPLRTGVFGRIAQT